MTRMQPISPDFAALRSRIRRGLIPLINAKAGVDSVEKRATMEIYTRLRQLEILLDMINKRLDAINASARDGPPYRETDFEGTMLFTESFYIFAFRVVVITKYLNGELFGGKKLVPEPKGISINRNHLIAHPEGRPIPILSQSFVVSEHDIQIKNSRTPSETWDIQDKGLNKNVAAFRSFITNWTEKAISLL